MCDWVLPACITPYLYWPLINIDDQLCTGNPLFSLFVSGLVCGSQTRLLSTQDNFTLIAFPRVLIKHRQKLRIYAAARGLEAVMFVASGAGEGAQQSLAWRLAGPLQWFPPYRAPARSVQSVK